MTPGRRSSTFTRLLRHGVTDPSGAERLLDSDGLAGLRADPVLLEAFGATADPDLALHGLVRLLEAQAGPSAGSNAAAAAEVPTTDHHTQRNRGADPQQTK